MKPSLLIFIALALLAGCAAPKVVKPLKHRAAPQMESIIPPFPTNNVSTNFPHCTNCLTIFVPLTNHYTIAGTNLGIYLSIRGTNFETIGLTNVDTNHVYSVLRRTTLTAGIWLGAANNLLGSNGSMTVTMTDTNQAIRFYTARREDGFVVWTNGLFTASGSSPCGGDRLGYFLYSKPIPDWGWTTNSAATSFSATDMFGTNCIQFFGEFGDNAAAHRTVVINPPFSPAYRFAIYFTTTNQSGQYPLWLRGFNE